MPDDFDLEADERARAWLETHRSSRPRLIELDVHRCCGGGKLCLLNIRDVSSRDNTAGSAVAHLPDGSRFLIDRRAAARLPKQLRLTVGGVGPFQHLDLELESEQWGDLLYS
jgi:hypothetical protein